MRPIHEPGGALESTVIVTIALVLVCVFQLADCDDKNFEDGETITVRYTKEDEDGSLSSPNPDEDMYNITKNSSVVFSNLPKIFWIRLQQRYTVSVDNSCDDESTQYEIFDSSNKTIHGNVDCESNGSIPILSLHTAVVGTSTIRLLLKPGVDKTFIIEYLILENCNTTLRSLKSPNMTVHCSADHVPRERDIPIQNLICNKNGSWNLTKLQCENRKEVSRAPDSTTAATNSRSASTTSLPGFFSNSKNVAFVAGSIGSVVFLLVIILVAIFVVKSQRFRRKKLPVAVSQLVTERLPPNESADGGIQDVNYETIGSDFSHSNNINLPVSNVVSGVETASHSKTSSTSRNDSQSKNITSDRYTNLPAVMPKENEGVPVYASILAANKKKKDDDAMEMVDNILYDSTGTR